MQNKQIKVLVIDDDNAVLESTAAALELEGFQVMTASNGGQGFQLITNQHPDMILLDVRLPDIDGFDMCKRIRKDPQTLNIPVIMVTGDRTVDIENGFSVGADDCIIKPIDMDYLVSRIKKLTQKNIKILLIEDDRQICDILTNVMTNQKYDLEVLNEGNNIIEKLKKDRPDLILLDITLAVPPDGIEICRLIKRDEYTKDIPVIMLTGSDNTESVEKCFGYGAEDYVFKPFNIQDLLLKIKKYILRIEKNNYKTGE